MMNAGYIKLWRSLKTWQWYHDPNVARLFIHLLMEVNHSPGKWEGIEIQSGQKLTSRQVLAKELGLSEQKIRTAITKLISTNEITVKTTSQYTLITIVNWEHYQGTGETSTNEITNYLTNKQPTNNQQITTNKNDKKKENKKESISSKTKNSDSENNSVKEKISSCPTQAKPASNQKIYNEVYDYYQTLNIVKHKRLSDTMKKAIDKAMRECKYTVEDMKKLLDRHKAKVEETKNSQYPVRPRELYVFFGQRVANAVHLICQDYEDGAKYGAAIKPKKPKIVIHECTPQKSPGNLRSY